MTPSNLGNCARKTTVAEWLAGGVETHDSPAPIQDGDERADCAEIRPGEVSILFPCGRQTHTPERCESGLVHRPIVN
jgi:hypothetical protein